MSSSELEFRVAALRGELRTRVEGMKQSFADEVSQARVVTQLESLAALSPANGFEAKVINQEFIDLSNDGSVVVEGPFLQLQFNTWWHFQYCIRYTPQPVRFVRISQGINKSSRELSGPEGFIQFVASEIARLEVMKADGLGYFARLREAATT